MISKIMSGGVFMNITLTQKERMLLEDQKAHEELCIKKYNDYANQAQDPQLKQMFQAHAQQEQEHLNSINQILQGQIPNTNTQQQGQQNQQNQQGLQSQQLQQNQQNQQMALNQNQSKSYNQQDAYLCEDLLTTEKYVSSGYDTTIFECIDTNLRQVLNHIQKEEQKHGEDISNYMISQGMYNPQ